MGARRTKGTSAGAKRAKKTTSSGKTRAPKAKPAKSSKAPKSTSSAGKTRAPKAERATSAGRVEAPVPATAPPVIDEATAAGDARGGGRAPKGAKATAKTSAKTKPKATSAKKATEPHATSAVPARPKDDAELGKELLRELTALLGRINDRAVEQILGDGGLVAFLSAVVPQKRKPTHSIHQHLAAHKRRASLMAEVRHAINESCSFVEGGRHVSPTRVQWFYDGLTFLEGDEPFAGVVGFWRDGDLRYGLNVDDLPLGRTLGPRESDFVSVDHAKKSLKAGLGDPHSALSDLAALVAEASDDVSGFVDVLERQPWMLGAQHTALLRTKNPDADLPDLFVKRSADNGYDVLVLAPPTLTIVGKNGKPLTALHELWHKAERQLSFVERQSDYLAREMQLKIKEPRVWLIAGVGLSPDERAAIREEKEAHAASVRFLTYDDLRVLAARTLGFFESRV